MARRRDKQEERRLAGRRMERLLDAAAHEAAAGRQDLADRYAVLVGRLAKKYQAGLPPLAKVRVCRRCEGHLTPGATARTRLRHGKVVTTCLRCGRIRRRPMEAP